MNCEQSQLGKRRSQPFDIFELESTLPMKQFSVDKSEKTTSHFINTAATSPQENYSSNTSQDPKNQLDQFEESLSSNFKEPDNQSSDSMDHSSGEIFGEKCRGQGNLAGDKYVDFEELEKQDINDKTCLPSKSEQAKLLCLDGMLAGYKIKHFINALIDKDTLISHHILVLEKCSDDGAVEYCVAKLTTNEKTNQHHLKKLAKTKFPITDLLYCGEIEEGSRVLYGYIDDRSIYRLCEMKIDVNLLRTVVSLPVKEGSALSVDSKKLFLSFCTEYVYFRETDTRIVLFPKDSITSSSMISVNVQSPSGAGVKKLIVQSKEYAADILSENLLYIAVLRTDDSTDIYSVHKDAEVRKSAIQKNQVQRITIPAPVNENHNALELLDVHFLPAYNMLVYVMKQGYDLQVFQYFLEYNKEKYVINSKIALAIKVDSSFFIKDIPSGLDQQPDAKLNYTTSLLREEIARTANIFILPESPLHRILKLNLKFEQNNRNPVVMNHMKIEISSEKIAGGLKIGELYSAQSGGSKRVNAFPVFGRPNSILLLKR